MKGFYCCHHRHNHHYYCCCCCCYCGFFHYKRNTKLWRKIVMGMTFVTICDGNCDGLDRFVTGWQAHGIWTKIVTDYSKIVTEKSVTIKTLSVIVMEPSQSVTKCQQLWQLVTGPSQSWALFFFNSNTTNCICYSTSFFVACSGDLRGGSSQTAPTNQFPWRELSNCFRSCTSHFKTCLLYTSPSPRD